MGVDNGIIILKNVLKSLAPSILEYSTTLSGMLVAKYARIIRIYVALTSNGIIRAKYVSLIHSNLTQTIYQGTSPPLNSIVKKIKKEYMFLYLKLLSDKG